MCFLDSGLYSIKTRCPSTEAAFIQTCWFWSRIQDFFPREWKVNVRDLQKMHGAGGGEPAGSWLGKRLCGLHIFFLPRSSQLSLLNLQHIKEEAALVEECVRTQQFNTASTCACFPSFRLLQKKKEAWSAASERKVSSLNICVFNPRFICGNLCRETDAAHTCM